LKGRIKKERLRREIVVKLGGRGGFSRIAVIPYDG